MISYEVFKKVEHAPGSNIELAVDHLVRRLTARWWTTGSPSDNKLVFQAIGLSAAGISTYVSRRLEGDDPQIVLKSVLRGYREHFRTPPTFLLRADDTRNILSRQDPVYGLIVDKIWLETVRRKFKPDVITTNREYLFQAAQIGYDKIVRDVRR